MLRPFIVRFIQIIAFIINSTRAIIIIKYSILNMIISKPCFSSWPLSQIKVLNNRPFVSLKKVIIFLNFEA